MVILDEERKRQWFQTSLSCCAVIMTLIRSSIPEACTDMNDMQKSKFRSGSRKLYNAIAAWAEDDFRSVNGQIGIFAFGVRPAAQKNGTRSR